MKSRRTKACDSSKSVKVSVYERDGGLCVLCGRPGSPNAHFVPRSHNGLGVEENILTLCPDCHRRFDQTEARALIRPVLERYLRTKYPDWNIENLYYRKANA